MPALAELAVGRPSDLGLIRIDRDKINAGPMQPQVQFASTRLTEARFDDGGDLQVRRGRHQPDRGGRDGGFESRRLGFVGEHCHQRRGVDHHQVGNPCRS